MSFNQIPYGTERKGENGTLPTIHDLFHSWPGPSENLLDLGSRLSVDELTEICRAGVETNTPNALLAAHLAAQELGKRNPETLRSVLGLLNNRFLPVEAALPEGIRREGWDINYRGKLMRMTYVPFVVPENVPNVAVCSNGAGIGGLTFDRLVDCGIPISSLTDMRRDLTVEKVMDCLRMASLAHPNLRIIIINYISALADCTVLVEAISKFQETTGSKYQVIVRLDGQQKEKAKEQLSILERVTICKSTEELILQAAGILDQNPFPYQNQSPTLEGIGNTPSSLEEDTRLIELLSRKDLSVIVQGTGETALRQISRMQREGTSIAACINPKRGGEQVLGIKVYASVSEATQALGRTPDITLLYVPAQAAKGAVEEALAAGVKTLVGVAENTPIELGQEIITMCKERKAQFLGLNSIGMVLYDPTGRKISLGNFSVDLCQPGPVSVVGRQNTIIYDVALALRDAGSGLRAGISVGGDAMRGLKAVDILPGLGADEHTSKIVVVGESGGQDEIDMLRVAPNGHINGKPIAVLMSGRWFPIGSILGHTGGVKTGLLYEEVLYKETILTQAGFQVIKFPSQIPSL